MQHWSQCSVKEEAYVSAELTYECTTAHEVRAISSPWPYADQVGLQDNLAAAFWGSTEVFWGLYLRDMTSRLDNMAIFGIVVMEQ